MREASSDRSVTDVRARLARQRAELRARDAAVVRLQVRLAQVPAPTGLEGRRARTVARCLRRFGTMGVHSDEAGNVVATLPGTRPLAPVLVLAHLDTVFPEGQSCAVRQAGRRYIGPGIGDNSRGLAAMIALAGILGSPLTRLRRPIIFAATTGEEGAGDLCGARHLLASLPEAPLAAIAVDGPGDDRVVHQAVGSRRFRVSFTGPGGHSWAARGAANPVHVVGRAIERLVEWIPRDPRTTLAVTRVGGGHSVNAIPEDAWIEVDVRGLSLSALEAGERFVREAARVAVSEENASRAPWSDPCAARIHRIGDRPAGVVDPAEPLVRCAAAATRAVSREPVLTAASTDANVPIALGIPAIAIGAGGTGGGAHTVEEWYENSEGALGLERALLILAATAGLED